MHSVQVGSACVEGVELVHAVQVELAYAGVSEVVELVSALDLQQASEVVRAQGAVGVVYRNSRGICCHPYPK